MSDNIPLTPIRTASSATGARKMGEGVMNVTEYSSTSPPSNDDEKNGFFKGGAAGRRKGTKTMSRRGTDGESIQVNGLGRIYEKIVNFSVVTRYMIFVIPIALFLAVPIVALAVFYKKETNANIGGLKLYLFFVWIEIVWLSIWISKLLAKGMPFLFMFLCGVVSSGTRKYATIIQAVEIPLSLLGWAIASYVAFETLTSLPNGASLADGHAKVDRWATIVKNVLFPMVIASILYLGEKIIIQYISIGYHRRSFDSKIKESKHLIDMIGHLYEASRTLFPMYCPEFKEEDYLINDSIEAMLAKTNKRFHHRSGSATPMKLIGEVGRLGDKVTSVFGNIASEITGKQVFNPTSAHSVVIEALEKTRSSEALAKRLWMSFVCEGNEALYQDDLEEVLGPSRKDEAEEIFTALDNDANGDISLDEMIMKVVEVGRERKSIANSMRDVGQAIGVLDGVLQVVLFVIIIFIFVAFQDTNFVTTLATAGTTLLSLSFVFAATTQEFLGSCIFLFVKHPYDVGDRVDIVGSEKEFLVVEQISLLYTIFKRIDNMKMVQIPNIVLNNLWVENVTRSKAMKEQLEMSISFDTTLEDIDLLRSEMESFVRHPDNSRDFQPEIILEATGIGNMDKLVLKVEIRHKSNWHNETVRAARRSKFMCALVLALRKIPIYGPGGGGEPLGGPTNPGYSVAVPDSVAADARAKAAAAKEAKRLMPTKKAAPEASSTGVNLGPVSEQNAADSLNARRPTMDISLRSLSDTRIGDETPTSAEDKRRSNDIDNLRISLLKRESTRGRRKPGEGVPPPLNTGIGPGFSVTIASPTQAQSNQNFSSTNKPTYMDEEAQMGMGSNATTSYQSPMNNNPYQNKYSPFPSESSSSPPRNTGPRPRKDSSVSASSGPSDPPPSDYIMKPPPLQFQFPTQAPSPLSRGINAQDQQNLGLNNQPSAKNNSSRRVPGQPTQYELDASPRIDFVSPQSMRTLEGDDDVLRGERV